MSYLHYYRRLPLHEKAILMESQQGRTMCGNMFYCLRELMENPAYSEFTVYYVINADAADSTRAFFNDRGYKNVTVVTIMTRQYFKLLASCKFLFTDTSFLPFFVKREKQIYLNTWHGTPLKHLGKKSKSDAYAIGNVMRNFCFADYLLFPNEFTMEHMIEDYMLENLSHAKVLLAGYPRNTAFFDLTIREKVRRYYHMEDKQVIAYLPTWRENAARDNEDFSYFDTGYFLELDKLLTSDQIMYVNIHPLAGGYVNYEMFKHIQKMPDEFETYEFLTAADCLVTDYSSVMFDYAITGKKIILFTYDKKEYLHDRGMYLDIDKLPFPMVSDVSELTEELRRQKVYDDMEFTQKFCRYDAVDICTKICDTVIFGKTGLLPEREIKNNGKENIIIYGGDLAMNGITTALFNLGTNIDMNERNYYVACVSKTVKKNLSGFETMASLFHYFPVSGTMNLGLFKKIIYLLFLRRCISARMTAALLNYELHTELRRMFGGVPFSHAIHFNGYESRKLLLYSCFDCKKTVFVHSDMREEIKTRANQRREVLKYTYGIYDNVAVVSRGIADSVLYFNKNAHVVIVENLINHEKVREKSLLPVTFNDDTTSTVVLEELNRILNSDSKIFVSVGRFSVEKGQMRLIEAFISINEKNRDTYLILIGGHGKLYDEIENYIRDLPCSDHIILIRSMTNPYAVVKRCSYLVLPSLYEGFGLVLAEGDICKIPVISTDIDGPRYFMKENGGYLVENSTEGIYRGMCDLLDGKVKVMNVDYEAYNANALNEFYSLLR